MLFLKFKSNEWLIAMVSMEKSEIKSSNLRGIIYALIVLIGNGFHPIISNSRPSELNATIFVFLMSLWEFIASWPFYLIEKRRTRKQLLKSNNSPQGGKTHFSATGNLIIVGIFFTIATYFYIEGFEKIGAIPASIALKSSPIYAMIIGTIFLKEKISISQILLTLCMLIGLFYLGTEGTWNFGNFSLWFGLMLLVPLLWTIGHSITKPLLEKGIVSSLKVIQIRSGTIVILMFIIAWIDVGLQEILISFINLPSLFYGFLMGFTYFLMHWSWYNSIKSITISYASALVTPSPIITVIFAWALLGEKFYNYHLVGMIISFLCLYGLIWHNYKSNQIKSTNEEQNGMNEINFEEIIS